MMNNKVSFTNSNNPTISLSAVIYFPPKFDETRQYPAIVVSHPGGGVKEQTAGTYAEKLAEKGFVTIAYDASYQGESGGEPRQLENPYIRTEDVSAVIDYLTTLSYVDNTRIGTDDYRLCRGDCLGKRYADQISQRLLLFSRRQIPQCTIQRITCCAGREDFLQLLPCQPFL